MSCAEIVLLCLGGLFFLTALGLLSQFSGWATLAKHYRRTSKAEPTLTWRHVVFGRVGWLNYSNCLSVAASSTGLHLTTYFPLRLGQPPLFFPWGDVAARKLPGVLWGYAKFKFAKEPRTAVLLTAYLGRQLLADAGHLGRPGLFDVE
jgi:hypothetical protein